jgi:hypothetical protein
MTLTMLRLHVFLLMMHVIVLMLIKNTRHLTEEEALSIGHGTMSGTGEVELRIFKEENNKLSYQSILHL